MKIAIFGKKLSETFTESILQVFQILENHKCEIFVYEDYYLQLKEAGFLKKEYKTYNRKHHNTSEMDCMVSVGGDGTLLDTVSFIKDSEVPVVGLNAGRLGFISSIALEEFEGIVNYINKEDQYCDIRSLIKVETKNNLFGEYNVGLNEVSIHKKDTASMIAIETYIGDEFLNKYWADGIIVATPTGSTAYSLSCGGPIVVPGSDNFVITPIAPHNLNVRPVVVSNNITIRLSVSGRSENFLIALDGRTQIIHANEPIFISKAPYSLHLLQPPGHTFLNTMRNKLAWGLDRRN